MQSHYCILRTVESPKKTTAFLSVRYVAFSEHSRLHTRQQLTSRVLSIGSNILTVCSYDYD
uniref:Uncharacterized protein n=1 Tax=Anguilla anguilla TaxID=7936 RepID=A0A0E9SNI0_ANGAN